MFVQTRINKIANIKRKCLIIFFSLHNFNVKLKLDTNKPQFGLIYQLLLVLIAFPGSRQLHSRTLFKIFQSRNKILKRTYLQFCLGGLKYLTSLLWRLQHTFKAGCHQLRIYSLPSDIFLIPNKNMCLYSLHTHHCVRWIRNVRETSEIK